MANVKGTCQLKVEVLNYIIFDPTDPDIPNHVVAYDGVDSGFIYIIDDGWLKIEAGDVIVKTEWGKRPISATKFANNYDVLT